MNGIGRLIGATILLVGLTGGAAAGEPTDMTAQEFRALITGNSIVGDWAGRPYKQYFAPGGGTDYVEKGKSMTHGRWRIADDGRYCSVWPPSANESCYHVQRDGNTLVWHTDGTTDTYRSQVVEGRQVDW